MIEIHLYAKPEEPVGYLAVVELNPLQPTAPGVSVTYSEADGWDSVLVCGHAVAQRAKVPKHHKVFLSMIKN